MLQPPLAWFCALSLGMPTRVKLLPAGQLVGVVVTSRSRAKQGETGSCGCTSSCRRRPCTSSALVSSMCVARHASSAAVRLSYVSHVNASHGSDGGGIVGGGGGDGGGGEGGGGDGGGDGGGGLGGGGDGGGDGGGLGGGGLGGGGDGGGGDGGGGEGGGDGGGGEGGGDGGGDGGGGDGGGAGGCGQVHICQVSSKTGCGSVRQMHPT